MVRRALFVSCPRFILRMRCSSWRVHIRSKVRHYEYESSLTRGEIHLRVSGWGHTVFNVDETVAVRQNFVDRANLANSVDYLKHEHCDLHDKFVRAIEEKRPDLLLLIRPKQ